LSNTYLTKTGSAVVKADGTATVVLAPDVGQFWAVSLVRVSGTQQPQFNSAISYPYCALYGGTVMDPTTFLDDTTLGSGDSSSIISGTIIMYGERITASWSAGVPGETVILSIYGRSSDDLTELQDQLAPIPGARFSGTTGNASVWQYQALQDNGPKNMTTAPPTFTVPSDSFAELTSFRFTLVTDAVAGTRVVGLFATTPIGVLSIDNFHVFQGATQAASLGWAYIFAQGLQSFSVGGQVGTSIPSRLILPPGSVVRPLIAGLDAGDTWTSFNVSYRRYTSLTKVSFS
jgi:hypothetical protein